jgi:hypothetical protein
MERVDDMHSLLTWLREQALIYHNLNQDPASPLLGAIYTVRENYSNEIIKKIENNVPNQRPHLEKTNVRP